MRIFTSACSLLLLSRSLLAYPTASSDDCAPVKYVVLGNHDIALHEKALHGDAPSLRIFNKFANTNCYKKKDRTVELSSRTDLQLRDKEKQMA